MNEADSERIAGSYQQRGYQKAGSATKADEIIINTCSVRQSAEDRVVGLLYNLSQKFKTNKKRPKVILTGCMLHYGEKKLAKMLPFVDEFLPISKVGFGKPSLRQDKRHAWVPISSGCNAFCSYCIVPLARGREKSRSAKEIIKEVDQLVANGYHSITLLGQNVNSYGLEKVGIGLRKQLDKKRQIPAPQAQYRPFKGKPPFVKLLNSLCQIKDLKRIDFLTSNPWDFYPELIDCISKNKKISRLIHLPVQSGDNRILKKMNRGYTRQQFLALIQKIRKKIPKIEFGTDIIVGFPGETKAQFNNTVDLCRKIGFKVAYIAKYSPRPETIAAKLYKDNLPYREKKRRWKILDELVNRKKKKLLIICGPTVTGKTELAIKLAKRFKGEIVSADSRQVYQGMDIGTGKDIDKFSIKKVPVWLLDVVRPDQEFSVAHFQKIASKLVKDIWQRNKLPIVAGGTGLYIKSLIEQIDTINIPPNKKLRIDLQDKTIRQLQERLKRLDLQGWRKMNNSDRQNPRRLIRAIEIGLVSPKSKARNQKHKTKFKMDDLLVIGLRTRDLKSLYERIDKRVEKRIKDGAEKEVNNLVKKYSWGKSVLGTTIGYKEWRDYFEGKIDLTELIQSWKFAEHAYARRQLTWFNKQSDIFWLDIGGKDFDKETVGVVQRWYGED